MSSEAVTLLIFLALGVIAVVWDRAQKSAAKERKASLDAERKAAVRRKYEGSPHLNDVVSGLIRQGMTSDMVVDSWGRPDAVDRKVYKTKVKEVWKYGPGPRRSFANRVTFENGIVVGWESR